MKQSSLFETVGRKWNLFWIFVNLLTHYLIYHFILQDFLPEMAKYLFYDWHSVWSLYSSKQGDKMNLGIITKAAGWDLVATLQQASRYWLVMLIMDSVRPVRCVRAGGQYFTFYRAGESLTQNSSGPATDRNVPPPPSPPRCYCVSGVVWTTFMDGQFRGEGNLVPLLL
jgi:hypothetical protein